MNIKNKINNMSTQEKIEKITVNAYKRLVAEKDETIQQLLNDIKLLEQENQKLDKSLWEHKYYLNEMRAGNYVGLKNFNNN